MSHGLSLESPVMIREAWDLIAILLQDFSMVCVKYDRPFSNSADLRIADLQHLRCHRQGEDQMRPPRLYELHLHFGTG